MIGWILVAAWVALLSLAAYAAIAADKRRAQRGLRRIREADLLVLALVGGTPGLVVGMATRRHKTRKASFVAKVVLVVAFQALVVYLSVRSAP